MSSMSQENSPNSQAKQGSTKALSEAHAPEIEIERKWLLQSLPDLSKAEAIQIRQGYLSVSAPDGSGNEIRLRERSDQDGTQCFITIKSNASKDGLERLETEVPIGKEEFEKLWQHVGDLSVEKTRFKLQNRDLIYEVDIFENKLKGLELVEVEFPSRAASEEFQAPKWFGLEVTADSSYKNAALAKKPAV